MDFYQKFLIGQVTNVQIQYYCQNAIFQVLNIYNKIIFKIVSSYYSCLVMQSNGEKDHVLTCSDQYQVLCDKQWSDHDNSGSFELIIGQQQYPSQKQQQKTSHKLKNSYHQQPQRQDSQDGIQFIENVELNRCSGDFYIIKLLCPTNITPKQTCTLSQWNDIFEKISNMPKTKKNSYQIDKELIQRKLKILNSILELSKNKTLHQAFERLVVKYSPGWISKGVNSKEKKKIDKYMNPIENILQDPQIQVQPLQKQKIINQITQVLLQYTQIDIQVSYNKGLQFLVMGILLAQTNPTIQRIKDTFCFLMLGKHALRRMYLPGSPLFFIQLKFLQESLRLQLPELFNKMINKCNTEKLFISCYKTMLLYKLTHRKIFQIIINLLLIYGIRVITMIIFCALRSKEETLLAMLKQNREETCQYVAKKMIKDYLQIENIEDHLLKQLGRTIMEDQSNWPI